MRVVIDTNVFVSASIFSNSVPRQAVSKALRNTALLFSAPAMNELKEVLFRSKIDRFVSREERAIFLAQLESVAKIIPIIQIVRECRDPRDDKFLEVALNGSADLIVSGDTDLLEMNPWRGDWDAVSIGLLKKMSCKKYQRKIQRASLSRGKGACVEPLHRYLVTLL
jgi:putative PIN family toxin of toxin-antitoxin system